MEHGLMYLGLVIWVNGYTTPTGMHRLSYGEIAARFLYSCVYAAAELEPVVVCHGGSFVNKMHKEVTHIIAQNLPNTKIKEFLKSKSVSSELNLDEVW